MMRRLRPHPSPPHARSGLSLIELLVVTSILSVILTLFLTVMFRVYQQQTMFTVATHQSSTWLRLARSLRADLHAATSAKVSGENGSVLELTGGGEFVRWTIEGTEVRRVLNESTDSATDSATGIERFVLPNTELMFELQGIEQRQQARLVAKTSTQLDPTLPTSSGTIESAVGLDRRWEGGLP